MNWIEEWLELWPDGIHSGGLPIKSKPKDCIKKMQKFCKDNKQYNKDCIFAATKLYLSEREKDNYKFTKRATYFISKLGEPSLLEAYCDKYLAIKNKPLTYNEAIKIENIEYDSSTDFI